MWATVTEVPAATAVHIDAGAPGVLAVDGDLVFDTVSELIEPGGEVVEAATGVLRVDLANVGRTDSAGLALLLEWLGRAREQSLEVRFDNVPAQMLRIAHASGLEELFDASIVKSE